MIVKDREKSIATAHSISGDLLEMITKELKDFSGEDDPAEQIYLGLHTIGSLLARMCISIRNYGEVYNIENLNIEAIKGWIDIIFKEYIKLNEK